MVFRSLGLFDVHRKQKHSEVSQALGTCCNTLLVEPVLVIRATNGTWGRMYLALDSGKQRNDTLMQMPGVAATVT